MSKTILVNNFIKNVRTAGAEVLFSPGEAAVSTDRWPGLLDFSKADLRLQYQTLENSEQWTDIAHALFCSRLGVAENGAVWLEDADMPHRILPFITRHLILRLATDSLVADMHEAYAKLGQDNFGFGVFISGPSKTADIEQSLVYGAHGAKELTVLLCD
ncbi:MAG: LUD domain-containing protein [Tannerellaceae bacterium]|nr:LUD domain-containing protein [Tannerellaceae bacterium]